MSLKTFKSTGNVLFRLTFKSTRRSAVLFGLLVGGMSALQGTAYVATYPDAAARAHFIASLSSAPALSILYGGDASIATNPAGYIVWRLLNALMLFAAIWGLMVITRLLRGQEDEGRWELLLSGQITSGKAVWRTLLGWFGAATVSTVVGAAIVALVGTDKDIKISVLNAGFFAVVIMLMAVLFAAIGALTSQLAATRRRAIVYGLIPLGVFFTLRALAHLVPNIRWINNFTPFGWLEKTNPIVGPRPLWILPVIALTVLCGWAAIALASRRDLGDSIIREADTALPHFGLLGGPLGLAFRLHRAILVAWIVGAAFIAGLIASLTKVATTGLSDSSSLTNAVSNLAGGNTGLALAFISMATFFVGLLLLILVANGLGSIRSEEASSYLDNILVKPISRGRWLSGRILLLLGAVLIGSLVTSTLTVLIAKAQNIDLGGIHFIVNSLNVVGPVALLLGIGIFLYGTWPRVAALATYVILLWSFLIDMISSVVKLNKILVNTSLFHHMTLAPTVTPKWGTLAVTFLTGTILAILGVCLFSRRDLEVE